MLKNRPISPQSATRKVAPIMMSQSLMEIGTTLKNSFPKLTIQYCPIRIAEAISRKPLHLERIKEDFPVANPFALKRFQNCSITNIVKKRLSSYSERSPFPPL